MNNRRSFIVGIKSTILLSKEKKFLKKYKPWGVILFARNIKNIEQTFKLTKSIRKIFNDNKYPILVDQEGGRVNRLKNIISQKFMISKILVEHHFIKIYYFLKLTRPSGVQQKQHFQKEQLKKILIKILFFQDLIIS